MNIVRKIQNFAYSVCNHIEYRKRRWHNSPMQFIWTKSDGVPVGDRIAVKHLTHYDMQEHAVDWVMTRATLFGGLNANAVEEVSFTRMGEHHGLTIIQPRLVESQ